MTMGYMKLNVKVPLKYLSDLVCYIFYKDWERRHRRSRGLEIHCGSAVSLGFCLGTNLPLIF